MKKVCWCKGIKENDIINAELKLILDYQQNVISLLSGKDLILDLSINFDKVFGSDGFLKFSNLSSSMHVCVNQVELTITGSNIVGKTGSQHICLNFNQNTWLLMNSTLAFQLQLVRFGWE